VDFEQEIAQLKQAMADIQVVMPLVRVLAANPGLVEKVAQDIAATATSVAKLSSDIVTVAKAVAAVAQHPALSIPPLQLADSYAPER
jgi:hypothetical protein